MEGLEPPTLRTGIWCSIQLSYMPFNFSISLKENLNILNLANLTNECIKKIFLNKLKISNFRNHKSLEESGFILDPNGIRVMGFKL